MPVEHDALGISKSVCEKVDALPSRDSEEAVDAVDAGPLPYGRGSERRGSEKTSDPRSIRVHNKRAGTRFSHRPNRALRRGHTDRDSRAVALKILLVAILPVAGAYAMAVASGSPERSWLGWFALLPLFAAIRLGGPAAATIAGAIWGTALWAFSALGPDPVITHSLVSSVLLPVIPAVYAGLAAWLTRRIGFNPLVLGTGWMLAELAFTPVCFGEGLLAETYRNAPILHWVGQAFGSVLVAFVVALAGASLVLAVSAVRLRIPRAPFLSTLQDFFLFPPWRTPLPVPLATLTPLQPRAPPITLVHS